MQPGLSKCFHVHILSLSCSNNGVPRTAPWPATEINTRRSACYANETARAGWAALSSSCKKKKKKYMDTILSGFKAELFFAFYPVCLDLTRFKYKPVLRAVK